MENLENKKQTFLFRGELALLAAVIINSFGVVLMLYSGAGISAISSVPYAFSKVLPHISLVPQYLFSFVVGFVFGKLLDFYELWINILPKSIPTCVFYFVISYILLCIGIALSNRCQLPIVPTDLFPREMADITGVRYSKIKIGFDVTCLLTTAFMTGYFLRHIDGLGIGTIVAAFTMGKGISIAGNIIDRHMTFKSFMSANEQSA